MTTKPDEVILNDENRKRIANLADRHGKQWTEVLSELIDSAEAVLGIQNGIDSAKRGEGTPASDVHEKLRDKHQFE